MFPVGYVSTPKSTAKAAQRPSNLIDIVINIFTRNITGHSNLVNMF